MNDMQIGPPPGGDPLGTIVVIAGTIATALAFVFAVRATVWPGETAPDHPKRMILEDDR
jgi:hypothetical protein